MTSEIQPEPFAHVVSLGTACWTAQLLKETGLKRYSCPFDWIFSAPRMVAHCLEDDFQEFLSRDHYRSAGGPQEWFLPLFRERYGLARLINHHDISRDDDFDYMTRSVDRFRRLLSDPKPKLFVVVSEFGNVFHPDMDVLLEALGASTSAFRLLAIGFEPKSERPAGFDLIRSDALRETYRLDANGAVSDGLRFDDERDNEMLRTILGRQACAPLSASDLFARQPAPRPAAAPGRAVASGPAARQIVNIEDTAVPGVTAVRLRDADHCPRPAPDFLYGPVADDALRHFHNDQYQPAVTVFSIRDVEVIGPWFITGTLLARGDVDFLCSGIALDPGGEESRRRLQEHLALTARGEKTVRRVPGQTLLLANNGHQIYGHWLVDFLPKLHLLALAGIDIDRVNVLLPANMGEFGEGFLRLLGVQEHRVIRYDPDRETIAPEELVVPTSLRWGGRCSPLFAGAIGFLNDRIDRHNRVPVSQHRRIVLSRAQSGRTGRPLLNEDRIEALAVEAGFTLVHPEQLPLLQQIALFRGAAGIVGQNGSGLHGTIFGRAGVVVAGLHGPLPAAFDALQSGIGERLHQPTGYVFATAVPEHENPWAITVDERHLAACLAAEFKP